MTHKLRFVILDGNEADPIIHRAVPAGKQYLAKMKQITIPKDQAVFWLDGNGRWHNRFGPFEHAKIINHFHASIQKDDQGFHLCQGHEGMVEKVYFPYEDTALFVFEVDVTDPVMVTLNTGRKFSLQPEKLFVVGDCLYTWIDGDRAKFTDRCLMKMAPLLSYECDRYVLKINGQSFVVSENGNPDDPV